MTRIHQIVVLIFGILNTYYTQIKAAYPYYGTKIGSLSQLHHGVSGDVYAVDSRTLFLKNFNYDGEAPAAYFYVGNSNKISNENGIRLRDEKGSTTSLTKRYRNKDITLSLPEGKTLRDIKWFSVWCDEFSVNFGDVKIPSNVNFPKPQKLASLNGVHGVKSDNIVVVDAQTLLIPNFSYDGEAPDAKFWVGRGAKPTPQGLRIPDENGRTTPLRRYDHKTIVLTLPGDLTIFDIGHFGVWCEAFTVDFGHIRIPEGLNVPPSLKMLGISPQSKLNCEVLYDDLAFEVRWAVAGESIVVQLVAKLEDNEYMSFGLSPNPKHTEMIGADVVVAWVDKDTGKGYAQDYYLDAKSQCSGTHGSCPDTRVEDETNSIRLLNAAMVNGYSIVTYQRSLKAADKLDLPISINDTHAIVWAIGPLNERKEVSFHSKYTKGDQFINFGRQPTWNCPMPEGDSKSSETENEEDVEEYYDKKPQAQRLTTSQPDTRPSSSALSSADRRRTQGSSQNEAKQSTSRPQRRPIPTPKPVNKTDAWEIPPIECYEPEDGVFYAQIGPTGGVHGYSAITGHVGWGISWYINGLLIPEIHLVRGKTYTFVVEGGDDPEVPARYHPFYITDDPIGGYEYKTEEERENVKIFAGVHTSRSGKIIPDGVGRYCNWTPNPDGPPADYYTSFGAYQRTLSLKCDQGVPGFITWTPDKNTPDTVYYQCFSHRYLGWKIHIHDSCEQTPAASEVDEVYTEPDEEDIVAESSIRHETKIRPNGNFLMQHENDLLKNHNMNGSPPKVQFELTKSAEITKLISDGIRAAEELEESIAQKTNVNAKQNLQHSISSEISAGGESIKSNNNSNLNFQLPHNQLPSVNPILPTYLVPPQTIPPMRPIKLPGRYPSIQIERRPNRPPHRPVILPQPSMIINHYQKPVPPIMRPFIKKKPFPIQPIAASVLLLGQQTELGPINRQSEPILKVKPKPGIIPVPYADSSPQNSKKAYTVMQNGAVLKTKKPLIRLPVTAIADKSISKPIFYKKPYEIKEDVDTETFKPAINTGFQPESIVVESGFKPIVRKQKTDKSEENDDDDDDDDTVNRRQDNSSDIDEALEGDVPIYNEDDNKSFEPMFIPSPPDSANVSVIREAPIILPRLSGDLEDMEVEDGDDKLAVAAERLDTYYLPPRNKPPPPGAPAAAAIPDGAVVTYDGKAVLDTSLLSSVPPRLRSGNERIIGTQQKGISKSEQLLKTPQFGPFRGEVPPPVPEFLSSEALASNLQAAQKPLNKPITEYSDPTTNVSSPISTKLTLVPSKIR